MKVGDIVRLKPNHYLTEFIKGDCYITHIIRNLYHIKNNENCMTWAYIEELDLVSDLRNQKLEKLGIK